MKENLLPPSTLFYLQVSYTTVTNIMPISVSQQILENIRLFLLVTEIRLKLIFI